MYMCVGDGGNIDANLGPSIQSLIISTLARHLSTDCCQLQKRSINLGQRCYAVSYPKYGTIGSQDGYEHRFQACKTLQFKWNHWRIMSIILFESILLICKMETLSFSSEALHRIERAVSLETHPREALLKACTRRRQHICISEHFQNQH